MVRQINLTEENSAKINELAKQSGKTPDEVANEAIGRLPLGHNLTEQAKFQEWKAALVQLKGMWADREDLPDFGEIRKSMDRDLWDK